MHLWFMSLWHITKLQTQTMISCIIQSFILMKRLGLVVPISVDNDFFGESFQILTETFQRHRQSLIWSWIIKVNYFRISMEQKVKNTGGICGSRRALICYLHKLFILSHRWIPACCWWWQNLVWKHTIWYQTSGYTWQWTFKGDLQFHTCFYFEIAF